MDATRSRSALARSAGLPRADGRRERLRGVRAIARWMDSAFEVPGTRWRIGLDPILGLVPGVGDLLAGALGLYVVLVAARLGAPASVVARIALNVAIDAAAGAIPLAGDLFDFGWRANTRNLALLEGWLERPAETRRASRLLVALVLLAIVAVVALGVWLAVRLLSALAAR